MKMETQYAKTTKAALRGKRTAISTYIQKAGNFKEQPSAASKRTRKARANQTQVSRRSKSRNK